MNRFLLYIRWKQLLGYLGELGWLRLGLAIVALSVGFFPFIDYLGDAKAQVWAAVLAFLGLMSVHLQRTDLLFLKLRRLASYEHFLVEYLLLLAPILGVLIYQAAFFSIIFLLLGTCLLPFIPALQFKYTHWQLQLPFLPLASFEWKVMLRDNFLAILVFYLLTFIFLYIPYTFPIFAAVLFLIFFRAYYHCESREMVALYALSPAAFLRFKVAVGLKSYLILFGPLCLVFMVFQWSFWWLGLLVFLSGSFLLLLAISLKYAIYRPGHELRANQLLIGLAVFSCLVPYLLPIPFILLFIYYRKAITNLNIYLDASN